MATVTAELKAKKHELAAELASAVEAAGIDGRALKSSPVGKVDDWLGSRVHTSVEYEYIGRGWDRYLSGKIVCRCSPSQYGVVRARTFKEKDGRLPVAKIVAYLVDALKQSEAALEAENKVRDLRKLARAAIDEACAELKISSRTIRPRDDGMILVSAVVNREQLLAVLTALREAGAMMDEADAQAECERRNGGE